MDEDDVSNMTSQLVEFIGIRDYGIANLEGVAWKYTARMVILAT